MNVASNFIFSLIILATGLVAILSLRRKILGRFGGAGLILFLGAIIVFGVPGVFWTAALLPPLNDPSNPIVLGVGGGNYGLDYDYYTAANAIVAAIIGSVIVSAILCISVTTPQPLSVPVRDQAASFLAYTALCGASAMFLLFFSIVGWDRFWHSTLGRFDFEANRAVVGLVPIRLFLPMLLLFGGIGALAYYQGKRMIGSIAMLLCAVPFVILSSRGLSLIVLLFMGVTWLKMQGWKRVFWVPVALFICWLGLLVPLEVRQRGDTGVSVAFLALFDLLTGKGSVDFKLLILRSLSNVGSGFPILVEGIQNIRDGAVEFTSVPSTYFLLAFSPLPSAIDGFAENWMRHGPRVNYFTPYGAVEELLYIGLPVLLLWIVAVIYFTAMLFRLLRRHCRFGSLYSIAIALMILNAFLQAEQYSTRTSMRFVYSAFAVGIILLALDIMLLRNRRRKRHAANVVALVERGR